MKKSERQKNAPISCRGLWVGIGELAPTTSESLTSTGDHSGRGCDCDLTAGLDSTEPPLGLIDVAELPELLPVGVPAVVVVPSQPAVLLPGLAAVHLPPVDAVQPVLCLVDLATVNPSEVTILQLRDLAVLHGG